MLMNNQGELEPFKIPFSCTKCFWTLARNKAVAEKSKKVTLSTLIFKISIISKFVYF